LRRLTLSRHKYAIISQDFGEFFQVILTLLALAALFLAFSNGANDNFKGFATVWGSATLDYRKALIIATIAAIAGSIASVLLANGLIKQFSGKGLVPDEIIAAPSFALAVATGAAATVMIATRVGLPISTTHALVGGLVGAGLASGSGEVNLAKLGAAFFLPLLLSPVISATLGFIAYKILPKYKAETDCVCVVEATPALNGAALASTVAMPEVVIGSEDNCPVHDQAIARTTVSGILDKAHIASAATICFARSVNDTPKLAALLVAVSMGGPNVQLLAIAGAMALGGLILSRRVAETMSQKITPLNPQQGVPANFITAMLVLAASKFGLPVSTTHVAVGAISGVGAAHGTLDLSVLRNILLSWVGTLPLAAAFAYLAKTLAG
jgi:inorganic phosphate transporter, PiT family